MVISMARPYDGTLVKKNGLVRQVGIADHVRGQVLGRNEKYIAVKWPSSKTTSYGVSQHHPPQVFVYRIMESYCPELRQHEEIPEERIEVEFLLDWSLARRRRNGDRNQVD